MGGAEPAAQHLSSHHSLYDFQSPEVQIWRLRKVRRDSLGICEEEVVVAASTADGHADREGVVATPRPANALLIVEADGGHIRHDHGRETADVDADLHRGRYRK